MTLGGANGASCAPRKSGKTENRTKVKQNRRVHMAIPPRWSVGWFDVWKPENGCLRRKVRGMLAFGASRVSDAGNLAVYVFAQAFPKSLGHFQENFYNIRIELFARPLFDLGSRR